MDIKAGRPFGRIKQASDSHDPLAYSRLLRRRHSRGQLVRLGNGLFAESSVFEKLDSRGRHLLAAQAASLSCANPLLFGGRSAAVILGLPCDRIPGKVDVWSERVAGGNSSPRIQRRKGDGRAPAVVTVSGLEVLDKANAALDLCRVAGFAWGVAALDRVLNARPLPFEQEGTQPCTKEELIALTGEVRSGAARARIMRAVAFADGNALFPGESLSRVIMAEAGFPPPQLQIEVRNRDGQLIGVVDFFWPELGLIGEFDGLIKYRNPEFMSGLSAEEVVIAEKIREDALRAEGYRVIRWTSNEVKDPSKLISLLRSAGLPQKRGHRGRQE